MSSLSDSVDSLSAKARYIPNHEELCALIMELRNQGKKIVLTQGSYDLIHIGHALYIERAKKCGDILVVAVDSDEKVRARKGPDRPIVSEDERIQMLSHIRNVDLITIKHVDTPKWDLIKQLRPDILIATKQTYTPAQIDALKEYCSEVKVLEPQATTSTTAKIRRVHLNFANRIKEAIDLLIKDA